MNDNLPTFNNEKTEAIKWLRSVLTAMLEVAPVSYPQKKQTSSLLSKIPEWLMANCADSLNIDYTGGCSMYPDMVQQVNSEAGWQLAQQYLENYDAVAAGNCLDQLVKTVVRQANENRLPEDSETIEKQVCALAWAECTEEGKSFAKSAKDILSDDENPNHPLVDYHLALARGDKSKIKALDATLVGGRYGSWVAERLTEVKRFLGLEPPRFTIHLGERTPQWDLLWKKVFTGGDE